jgi:hypothetical protein
VFVLSASGTLAPAYAAIPPTRDRVVSDAMNDATRAATEGSKKLKNVFTKIGAQLGT